MELQKNAPWYSYLDHCQRELIGVSFALTEQKEHFANLKDFSFIVFPAAKAYEGFLKKVFYDMQLINKDTYEGRHFRIGRALNPDIRSHQRDQDWLYDNVEQRFGKALARQLWDTWLLCRNHVFHYFSDCEQFLTFTEAVNRLEMIQDAIEAVAEQLDYNLGKIKEERDYANSVQL